MLYYQSNYFIDNLSSQHMNNMEWYDPFNQFLGTKHIIPSGHQIWGGVSYTNQYIQDVIMVKERKHHFIGAWRTYGMNQFLATNYFLLSGSFSPNFVKTANGDHYDPLDITYNSCLRFAISLLDIFECCSLHVKQVIELNTRKYLDTSLKIV